MSLLVKICGLQKADDVKAAVSAGADAVGFVFAESVRRVTPAAASKLTQYLPKRVKRVAVMRHPTQSEWQEVLETFSPDVLQTDIDDFEALDVPGSVERWPVIREGYAGIDGRLPGVFLYEGQRSGAGQTVDWPRAAEIAKRGRMILAGGLGIDNIATAIRTVRPHGVDVSSGVESRPGRKDPGLIQLFIKAARAVEKQA
jgi:phosphoribosylanthranilate isomerase